MTQAKAQHTPLTQVQVAQIWEVSDKDILGLMAIAEAAYRVGAAGKADLLAACEAALQSEGLDDGGAFGAALTQQLHAAIAKAGG